MLLLRAGALPLELGYCSNVHPASSVQDIRVALQEHARPLRIQLGCPALVVGLHLGEQAVRELATAEACAAFARFLQDEQLRVVSLNVFPQRPFHEAVVKHAVYEPDWTRAERRDYTLAAARCLLAIAPTNASPLTLSTLPLGHASLRTRNADCEEHAAQNLLDVAMDFAALEQTHCRTLQLAIEPEPGCLLETAADLARFFSQTLLPLAQQRGLSPDTIQRHIGACFDCCHGAVMFEPVETALQALASAGCKVFKVQISAAIEADLPAAAAALQACAEPRYLHQTSVLRDRAFGVPTEWRPGQQTAGPRPDVVDDLPLLPAHACGTARTHFHIPIHAQPTAPLRSTAATLPAALQLLAATGCTHYEVETYTFHVLPGALRNTDDLVANLASELTTAAKWLRKCHSAP